MDQELRTESPDTVHAVSRQSSVFQRIWKYKLHYVIVIPAIMLLFYFKVIPFIQGVLLSFKDYSPFKGIGGSEWTGLTNYTNLWGNPGFVNAFTNTLALKTGYLAASAVLAFIIALSISGIRSGRLRDLISSLLLLPYFIPSLVIGGIVIICLSPTASPFISMLPSERFLMAEPGLFRVVLIAAELFKTIGIPVVIALAAIVSKHASFNEAMSGEGTGGAVGAGGRGSFASLNIFPALRAVTAVTLLQLSAILTTDFDLVFILLNPLVFESGMTLEMYAYREGLLQANIGPAAAVSVIQFLIQFAFAIVAYLLVRRWFLKDLFSRHVRPSKELKTGGAGNITGVVVAAICSAGIMLVCYMIFIYPFTVDSGANQPGPGFSTILIYVLVYVVAVIVGLLMTLTLAYPLTVKDLPGRNLYKLLLLFVLVTGSGYIMEYIYFRNMGLVNTMFPLLFTGFMNVINVFVLKSIFNSKYGILKEQASADGKGELHTFFTLFIPKIWKPLLALGMLQFVTLWNSPISSIIYINDQSKGAPMTQVYQMIMFNSGDIAASLRFGALLSIPSMLIYLIFRKWLTSEAFISQIRKL